MKVGHRFLCESMKSSPSASCRPGSITETVSRCPGAPCHAVEHFCEKTSHRMPSCNTAQLSRRALSSSSSQVTLLLTFNTGITVAPGNDHLRILYIRSLFLPLFPADNLHQASTTTRALRCPVAILAQAFGSSPGSSAVLVQTVVGR